VSGDRVHRAPSTVLSDAHHSLLNMPTSQLVLQPRGTTAHKGPANFQLSVRRGIRLADYATDLGSDLAALTTLYPDGVARLWGSTPTESATNAKARALRDRQVGDKVLFYADKGFFAEAIILHLFNNPDAAKSIWGTDGNGDTWEHMMALGQVQEFSSPIAAETVLGPLDMSVPLRSITLIPTDDHAKVADMITGSSATPRQWLLQCNPTTWDVWRWWEEGTVVLDQWSIYNHRADLRPGDRFAFWISGDASGVYGIGTVTSHTHTITEFDDYWIAPPSTAEVVGIQFDRYLFDAPVTQRQLASHPDFASSEVMSLLGQSSAIKLTPEQWDIIETAALQRGRTTPPAATEIKLISRPISSVPKSSKAKERTGGNEIKYPEANLVREYADFVDRELQCIEATLSPDEKIVCDAFDVQKCLLIEAKGSTARYHIRTAIGQLLDYQHYIKPDAALAVLLPGEPSPTIVEVLRKLKIKVIYRDGSSFHGPI
jgi:predicted RNA-binding protein with PUA-like domain